MILIPTNTKNQIAISNPDWNKLKDSILFAYNTMKVAQSSQCVHLVSLMQFPRFMVQIIDERYSVSEIKKVKKVKNPVNRIVIGRLLKNGMFIICDKSEKKIYGGFRVVDVIGKNL